MSGVTAGVAAGAMASVMSAGASLRRLHAVVLRYLYLLRGSWPRLLEQAYWPTVQMIIWGFITIFLAQNSTWVAQAVGILLSAVLLWDVLFRSQLGISVPFMEEMFARNLAQLFVSPLRVGEFLGALMLISLLRTLVGVGTAAVLAIALYSISLFELGWPLLYFFVSLLVFGWAIGLVMCALLLRFGLGVESLAWASIFALAPISCIYYPLAILPQWLQLPALYLPSSYAFEGMREILLYGRFDAAGLARAAVLNVAYLALGCLAFRQAFRAARERGLLLRLGE